MWWRQVTYLPPDIIDNDGSSLAEALVKTATAMGQRRLDVATGYFTPRVWSLVGEAFAQLGAFRMLLGEEPEVDYAQVRHPRPAPPHPPPTGGRARRARSRPRPHAAGG